MENRSKIEVSASNVEEAIQKGLEELGLTRDEVDIEILDEGGSGLFGLGDKEARVEISVASARSNREMNRRGDIEPDPEQENTMAIAKATVQELLDHMGVFGKVTTHLRESEDSSSNGPIVVNIEGNDLSVLIGRNAENLNALQLITRMIVGKEIGHSAHLIVDVEGYRERREDNLRQLAQRMASQAVTTGRRQSLEPMTPAERRIIHIELRDHEEVQTESSGEDPKRKVVIIPKYS